MGTLHLVVNVHSSRLEDTLGDWLPARLVFIISLFLTLTPHYYVIYCQARGLSGHTSPCGECAFLILRLRPGTGCLLGWSFTILLLWTLAPTVRLNGRLARLNTV